MPITIDAHSDILNDIHPRRLLGEKAVLEKFWVPKMRKGRIDIRVVAIYTEPPLLPELALRRGLDLVASLYEDIGESPSTVLCRTYGDIQKAKEAGKIGLILGIEGAEPLGTDIQLLRVFYELGLRVLGLTHALRTYLADGAFFSTRKTGQLGGLTDVGANACSAFVNPPDLEHLVDHIEHIVKVGGIEHAGLGPDFADYLLVYMTEVDKASMPLDGIKPVRGLPGDEAFPKFAEELARRGYKPRDVDLIMGENFARVFKDILKP